MKILALDLATATGVAIGDAHGAPLCHTERLGQAGQPHGARFSEALHMTRRLIEQHKPDLVVIESPIVTGVKGGEQRAQLAMGLRACVLAVCHMRGVKTSEYAVQSIRKHFIGDPRAKRDRAKRLTIERCQRRGWHVSNDNEADACAVWDYARAKIGVATPTPNGLFDTRPEQEPPTSNEHR